MEILNPVTQLVLPAAVVLVMFALGTTLTTDDLRRVIKEPRAIVVGLFAHALVLPLLALGLAAGLGLEPRFAIGLVIVAACPANAASNLFTHLAGGDTMLSVCLTAALSLTTVLTLPLFVNLAFLAFQEEGHGTLRLPVLKSAFGLFLIATLPVLLGMHTRRRRPAWARQVESRMGAFGIAVILVVIAVAVWSEHANVLPALARAGAAALLLNLCSVALAWGGAALAGLPGPQRTAIGLECGLQNFAMAAFVCLTLLGDGALLRPAIAYGLVMWLSAIAVVVRMRARARSRAA